MMQQARPLHTFFRFLYNTIHYRFIHSAYGMTCCCCFAVAAAAVHALLKYIVAEIEMHKSLNFAYPMRWFRVLEFEWQRWQMSHIELEHQFIIIYYFVSQYCYRCCHLCHRLMCYICTSIIRFHSIYIILFTISFFVSTRSREIQLSFLPVYSCVSLYFCSCNR